MSLWVLLLVVTYEKYDRWRDCGPLGRQVTAGTAFVLAVSDGTRTVNQLQLGHGEISLGVGIRAQNHSLDAG